MDILDILKVAGLFAGILGGFLAALFTIYAVLMKIVSLFNASISYNVYETPRRTRSRR